MSHDFLTYIWEGRASPWDGERSEVGQHWVLLLMEVRTGKTEGLPSMPHVW